MKPFRLVIVAAILTCISGCAVVHSYGPYLGKVVDKDTKEPLEGAAVLAVCYTESYGPGGSSSHYVGARETFTDKKGEFEIPAFTVWTFRPLQNFESYAWFRIFKPGYGCYPKHKQVDPMFIPNGSLPEKEYVQIEIPKLTNMSERINNYYCYPSPQVPESSYLGLHNLIRQERAALGLESN